ARADAAEISLLRRLADRHPALRDDTLFRRLLIRADEAGRRAEALHTRVAGIAADARRLQERVPALRDRLRTAAAQLTRLDQGARQVALGAAQVDQGTGQALTGARKLDQGTMQLVQGSARLSSGLAEMYGQIPRLSGPERTRAAETLARPVEVRTSNAHPAGEYGRGMAPFFFSIALWVFGIVAFLLLRPLPGRLLASRAGASTVALASWLPVLALGACGAVVLFAVVSLTLGLRPLHVVGTVVVMVLGVASFSAVVHLLRAALGAAGDALALVLLMIQLVSCGGLYPVETLPLPFRVVHHVVPMTYLVEPLRVTISGGDPWHLWRSVGVLLAYLVAALALLVVVVRAHRTWTMGRLRPSLEL
ncbi:MAG TPA: YhgE/Pip family protein, partial [Thermomonospora sp.]|nr:YhgE/Pip family protein [Thermomonospora sp.]